ncbi:DUF5798 family protein [Halobaculum rubrum]|uniref:DUF5798 family protein n=1 Tax=Halobaculum rubrum TaxID=2872158 RepID=UPI001CA3AAF2|nr:DUF5798 family protein [Halobaculum rubrum]QZX98686.1 DUF5798 family protein [Halobaculum rubrum]
MGFGSTAKKLQTVADLAEKLYTKVNEIRERVEAMQGAVQSTEQRVETLERDLAQQRAIVEAIAEAQDIDVDAVVAEVTDERNAEEADEAGTAEDTSGTDNTASAGTDESSGTDDTPGAGA